MNPNPAANKEMAHKLGSIDKMEMMPSGTNPQTSNFSLPTNNSNDTNDDDSDDIKIIGMSISSPKKKPKKDRRYFKQKQPMQYMKQGPYAKKTSPDKKSPPSNKKQHISFASKYLSEKKNEVSHKETKIEQPKQDVQISFQSLDTVNQKESKKPKKRQNESPQPNSNKKPFKPTDEVSTGFTSPIKDVHDSTKGPSDTKKSPSPPKQGKQKKKKASKEADYNSPSQKKSKAKQKQIEIKGPNAETYPPDSPPSPPMSKRQAKRLRKEALLRQKEMEKAEENNVFAQSPYAINSYMNQMFDLPQDYQTIDESIVTYSDDPRLAIREYTQVSTLPKRDLESLAQIKVGFEELFVGAEKRIEGKFVVINETSPVSIEFPPKPGVKYLSIAKSMVLNDVKQFAKIVFSIDGNIEDISIKLKDGTLKDQLISWIQPGEHLTVYIKRTTEDTQDVT